MGKITVVDRVLLLATCLFAAYQISFRTQGLYPFAIWGFTVGFGILLVSCLLLFILGFDGLERQAIVIVSTLIPLSISFGLVSMHVPEYGLHYLIFCGVGFGLIGITRFVATEKVAALVLALIHGIAGLLITILPVVQSLSGRAHPGYMLVGLGGILMGIGGILFTFFRAGRPLIPQEKILSALPVLLLLMTVAFIGGFSFQ